MSSEIFLKKFDSGQLEDRDDFFDWYAAKKVLIPGSQIETIINECPIVTHFSIEFDEIDVFVGYLKGTLELIDASVLHFMEFVEIKNDSVILVKYKYHEATPVYPVIMSTLFINIILY
jgi:hypothetical protein